MELWTFETARFRIVCTMEEEFDHDLSWDEDGETERQLHNGTLVAFCARVAVYLDGHEIAADYLGNCIYESGEDFVSGHRDPDPMNRNCSVMRQARGNVCIGHYFPDMVRQAIGEARRAMHDFQSIRLRAA